MKNQETGAMVRMKDTSDDATNARAFMNAYHGKALVAVIAGKPTFSFAR